MADELQGKKIAFLTANEGVEEVELTAFNHRDKGETFDVDRTVGDADSSEFDGLVLPGGFSHPDNLRTHEDAVFPLRSLDAGQAGRCPFGHGPWTLIEADLAKGRKVASWPSLETDLRNAGAEWVDEEVVTDSGLVTSRKPDDLPAFDAKIVEEFAEGIHAGQAV